MIEPIKSKQTLAQSEIQDGDVITVQRIFSEKEYVLVCLNLLPKANFVLDHPY
jgi:hypothetical protein